jgi:hypothetical protein
MMCAYIKLLSAVDPATLARVLQILFNFLEGLESTETVTRVIGFAVGIYRCEPASQRTRRDETRQCRTSRGQLSALQGGSLPGALNPSGSMFQGSPEPLKLV